MSAEKQVIDAPSLQGLLKQLDALPTLPQVVRHILESINDDSANTDRLVRHINTDPAIVGRLLGAANSSAFGLASPVDSTRQAILVLGLSGVRTITLATALIKHFSSSNTGLDAPQFWRHSLGVATCAQVIARHFDCNPEAAFSAGLLHDIGQLLMSTVAPEHFSQVRARVQDGESITHAEMAIFNYDHAMVGGKLARQWRLPEDIICGIHGHHDPDSGIDGEIGDLIHVAEVLSHALDLGKTPYNLVPEVSDMAPARLGFEWPELAGLFPEIEARYDGLRQALSL
ncbi:MAG: HDOD domain-containing protein [Zoogloeaceae bacterium]|nr:HDOD domain-containing protein [Zoogloeaceae bacterium]